MEVLRLAVAVRGADADDHAVLHVRLQETVVGVVGSAGEDIVGISLEQVPVRLLPVAVREDHERIADDEKSFAPHAEQIMADLRDATTAAVACGAATSEVVDFVAQTADNCAALVDLLAYHLVPAEESELRQQLLDETNVEARAKALIARIAELADNSD